MKYVLFSFVSFLVVLPVLTGCVVFGGIKSLEQAQIEQKEQEPDKIYEGSAFGYRGHIYVQVSLSGGSISEITVIDSDEDRFVGGAAMEELIETVIELNSADVDAVSGATITSKGFLEAVRNAIMSYE
jgi:fumarate reductase flavoprotein subunit